MPDCFPSWRSFPPTHRFLTIALGLFPLLLLGSPVQHATVFFEKGKYGGWPATHGIWSWGDEILVGFTVGIYQDRGDRHHIATDQPVSHMQGRSRDGGLTWTLENPNQRHQLLPEGTSLHGTELPGVPLPEWKPSPGDIRFTAPDFAMTLKLNNNHVGPSRFYLTYNRGRDWSGPYRLPAVNGLQIAARTDYQVRSPSACDFFLTAAKANQREGRVFLLRSTQHGRRWEFVSWVGEEPSGFSIMPSTIRLAKGSYYTVLRHRDGSKRGLRAYRSIDDGKTWHREIDPVTDLGAGNPGSLLQLPDGTLALTYGVRKEPFRIAAKLSRDQGRSWSAEGIIRHDGSSADVGYTQSVLRPDGKVVTVYYFSDAITGPERYIGASIWDPKTLYFPSPQSP